MSLRSNSPASWPEDASRDTPERPSPVTEARHQSSVVVLRRSHELLPHLSAWESLAVNAGEPNVFHEPLLVLPTLRAFGAHLQLRFVLVFLPADERPNSPPLLCGLFPFVRQPKYYGLPVPTLRLLVSDYMVFGTPLVRAGYGRAVLARLFEWLRSDQNDTLFTEFADIDGEGEFARRLTERLDQEGLTPAVLATHTRALLRRAASAEEYIAANSWSGKHRKELRRQARRLADSGNVTYAALQPGEDVQPWIDDFLRLEASGWKGTAGTAFAAREPDREFFVSLAREAHRRGRLMMLALCLDGRPIAMKCNLRANEGSFAFKICFDEADSRFSPGVLLEIANIRLVHDTPGLQWMDSCAIHQHFMINRLWTERRIVQTLVVPTAGPYAQVLVAGLPLAQAILRPSARRGRRLAGRIREVVRARLSSRPSRSSPTGAADR